MGRGKCCFAIRYVLESGALMVTAHMPTKVGDKCLENAQSLLLMPNTIIQYTVRLTFSMDSHCVQSHKVNYLRYSERFGVEDARYLPTSISQPVVVGDYQKYGNSWGEWLWGYSPGGAHQNGRLSSNEDDFQGEAEQQQGSWGNAKTSSCKPKSFNIVHILIFK